MATIRPGLRYSAEHQWVDESVAPVRVGITSVVTELLGEIVALDLPDVGSEVGAGQACGEVESITAVAELYAPVSGTVVAVNPVAVEDPSLVSAEPYGDGWLLTVEAADRGELMSAEEYAEANGAEIAD